MKALLSLYSGQLLLESKLLFIKLLNNILYPLILLTRRGEITVTVYLITRSTPGLALQHNTLTTIINTGLASSYDDMIELSFLSLRSTVTTGSAISRRWHHIIIEILKKDGLNFGTKFLGGDLVLRHDLTEEQ